MSRILESAATARHADLEAWETALRAAVLTAGANALAALLRNIGSGRQEPPVLCQCAGRMESQGLKEKQLLTILGPVPYSRSMFVCAACSKTRYPGDEMLDTGRSPGLRRMMARAGSQGTFNEGRDDLDVYAGIGVSAKDVERVAERIGEDTEKWLRREREKICQEPPARLAKTIPILYISYDGTGVPMTRAELKGRKGKQPDGSARTREAKLGCVFTQTTTDDRGFPLRDPESTSFVGAIEPAEEFGWRIYAEAVRRGLHSAAQLVILADGAEWIWNLAATHFPGATLILDLYHARQHVSSLCKLLFGSDEKQAIRHRMFWWAHLDKGAVEKIVLDAGTKLPADHELRETAEKEIAYLEKNKERMRYAQFRAAGLFVGSGVVEAGCGSVIGQRLKRSGMEWSLRGANAIISLRCVMTSGRFEEYWEDRTA
ncbi:MAG: ISKra4 family transposase [Thermoanaerobaculia bacterium]